MLPDITRLLTIAQEAGQAILLVYNNPQESGLIKRKTDESPLTLADEASHVIIEQGLRALTPAIPVLSEEGADIPYEERRHWETFWCVDPLDGTREFINRNGEFTVNIALIEHGVPVLGVIYVPVTDTMYYGGAGMGSFKRGADGTTSPIRVDAGAREWVAVGSRSHAAPEEAQLLSHYPIASTLTAGSSLKFCLVAEGKAHVYYRHGPTMEWDTAAGQALVTASGGVMTTPEGAPFTYNKPVLRNGSFLCKAR